MTEERVSGDTTPEPQYHQENRTRTKQVHGTSGFSLPSVDRGRHFALNVFQSQRVALLASTKHGLFKKKDEKSSIKTGLPHEEAKSSEYLLVTAHIK